MRNKNAKELIKIIRLLISNDDESALLGLALFENHYLLTGLNKYKKFRVSHCWPGFSSNKPKRFDGYGANWSREFTKEEFIKEIYINNTLDLSTKILLVLNFIQDSIQCRTKHNRNRNYYVYNFIHDLDKTDKEIFNPIKKVRIQYPMKLNESYKDSYIKFIKELEDYGDFSTFYRTNNGGINNHILDYKLYLINRYRKNKGKYDYLYKLKSLFKSNESFNEFLNEMKK